MLKKTILGCFLGFSSHQMSMTWHPKDVRNRPTRAAAAELGARAGIGFAEVGVTQGAPGEVWRKWEFVLGASLKRSRSAGLCRFMDVYDSWWVCGFAWFRCVFVFSETCCICRYDFYSLLHGMILLLHAAGALQQLRWWSQWLYRVACNLVLKYLGNTFVWFGIKLCVQLAQLDSIADTCWYMLIGFLLSLV